MNSAVPILYVAMLGLCGLMIWHAIDIDRRFRAMDERMWNVENAQ